MTAIRSEQTGSPVLPPERSAPEAEDPAMQDTAALIEKLKAAEQQLRENDEKWRLLRKRADLTAALSDRLTPACGREMAEELSRMMCAGADLSALRMDENGACDPACLTETVEKLRAAWPACFTPRPRLQGIEKIAPPMPADVYEPKELSDAEYYSRLYKE